MRAAVASLRVLMNLAKPFLGINALIVEWYQWVYLHSSLSFCEVPYYIYNAVVSYLCRYYKYMNIGDFVIAKKVFIRGWYVFLDKRLKVIHDL